MGAEKQDIDLALVAQICRHGNSFRIYNKFKIDQCLRQCSEAQREAFYLVPYLLNTYNPQSLGVVDGETAPCGIYAYSIGSQVPVTFKKYFPKDDYDLRNTDRKSAIEFLSLMGSVGTLAFSEKSDFDYWVCLRENLTPHQLFLLNKKLRNIEQWCERELSVEVHFFTMTGSSLRENNFGEVSSESCGSAQAKLLKEEYFRSSILVHGKTSLWWVAPAQSDDKVYQKVCDTVRLAPDRFPESYIDIGNLTNIPVGEFLGAGLWQLNKGIQSPYKSVMKLALLLDYSSRSVGQRTWLAEELLKSVQANAGSMDNVDGYCSMMNRVLTHFSTLNPEDLETLRICFFVKIGCAVSLWMEQKKDPPQAKEKIVLNYIREWGWTRRQVEEWENILLLSVAKTLQLKRRIEAFMLRGLRELFALVGPLGLKDVMGEMDQTRLLNRLLSVYDSRRERVEWCYAPFDRCLVSKAYTFVRVSHKNYRLYRGEINTKNISSVEEKSFLIEERSLEKMVVWLIYNGLVHANSVIFSNLSRADDFARNLKNLATTYRRHFGRISVSSLDGAFSKPAQPKSWIIAVNMIPKLDRWLGSNSLQEEVNVFKELFSREKFRRGRVESRRQHSEGFDTIPLQRIEGVLSRINAPEILSQAKGKKNVEDANFIEMPTTMTRVLDLEETVNEARVLLHPDEDVLNAWDREYNLCRELILLEKNTWGEVSVMTYHSEEGLMNLLLWVLQVCCTQKLNLTEAIALETGCADFDTKRIGLRFQNLLIELEQFFFCEAASTPTAKSCFMIAIGGRLFMLSREKELFSYQEFLNLAQACMEVNLTHPTEVRYHFDMGNRRWNFYQEAIKDYRKGQIQLYAQKGTRASYFMVIDESGNVMITEMPRDEIKTGLPRFVYSLGLCLRKMQECGLVPVHQAFKVAWFQRDEKNRAYMEDITQKVVKAVVANLPRLADIEMVLPWTSCHYFLRHYSEYGTYRFDSDVVNNELRYVTKELQKMRKGDAHASHYPVFLSEFQIVAEPSEGACKNTCLWLQLKTHLEKACLKSLSGHRH